MIRTYGLEGEVSDKHLFLEALKIVETQLEGFSDDFKLANAIFASESQYRDNLPWYQKIFKRHFTWSECVDMVRDAMDAEVMIA